MKPERYESHTESRRISGTLQRRGAKLGLSTCVGFLFGGVFVAVGSWIILMGTKVVTVDPRSVHAPYWVLTAAGASFAMGGLMVWGMTWKQFAANRRRIRAGRQYPNEPALADYHWHPEGFEVSEWPGVAKVAATAMGLTVFLSMFNWWAFFANGPWMVKGIVGLFDLVALAVWCQAAMQLGRALKFGHSRIVFSHFPYGLSEPVNIRWEPFRGISQVRKGTFTLRCVEEWMESSGGRRDQSVNLVHNELWSGTWSLAVPRNFGFKEEVELRYELPADARATQLSGDKPVFWELEVKIDLPGLDFKETYLVPIYGSRTGSEAKPAISEFRFSCPNCGQNILCDSGHVGAEIACPTCQASITVPGPASAPADASALAGTAPVLPSSVATAVPATSRLAVASLICSLLSAVTLVGWLPGIICGHLAKARIRRNPSLKGSGFATAGLVIGYLVFISEMSAGTVFMLRFSAAVKQGYESVRQELATNKVIVAQAQPPAPSNGAPVLERVEPVLFTTNTPQIEFTHSAWTSDIGNVSIPRHPVNGKLHGMDFTVRTAMFRKGDLKLTSTNRIILDVFHLDASVEGKSYEIQFADHTNTNPHVKFSWKEEGATQTLLYNDGYGMKLQFGQPKNGRVAGKLYLCLPDDIKSYVAGTFVVRLPQNK